jgi:hypothetical protein
VAWLGATLRAVRRRDVPSALSNALLVNSHNVSVEQTTGVLVLESVW